MSLDHRRLPPKIRVIAVLLGLLGSMVLIWQPVSAAFTGTASNPSNSWAAGTVTLSDDDGGNSPTTGTAMFSTANLMPGNTATHCIRVTYGGSLTSLQAVKVYATGLAGTGLGTYLDLTIEEDTNGQGTFNTCGSFAGTYIYQAGTPVGSDGTLAQFAANMTDYTSAVGTWTPTATGQAKTYRFRYTVHNNDLAQGLTATVNFVWETRNS